jgi:hypothetical protein
MYVSELNVLPRNITIKHVQNHSFKLNHTLLFKLIYHVFRQHEFVVKGGEVFILFSACSS